MVGPDAARGLLTDPYEPLLIAPRAGFGICVECFNTTIGFDRCYACARAPRSLDVVVPITYSVAHEPIHIALAAYKRRGDAMAERMQAEIAAVLSRFLESSRAVPRGCDGGAAVRDRDDGALWRPRPGQASSAAADRRRALAPDARSLSAAPPSIVRRVPPAPGRSTALRGDARACRRAGAPRRRYVDDGRERQKCRARAQAGGGRSGRRGRDRAASEPWVARERRSVAEPRTAF